MYLTEIACDYVIASSDYVIASFETSYAEDSSVQGAIFY